jgi:hypothetical protein
MHSYVCVCVQFDGHVFFLFAELELGTTCSTVTVEQVCKDANAVCSNGKCACGSNYYDDNGAAPNGTCLLSKFTSILSCIH